jgi:hypothetical protein
MRRASRLVKLLTVNILIFLVCMEVFSFIHYQFKEGRFFYTDERAPLEKTEPSPLDEQPIDSLTNLRIHPYFGFIDRIRNTYDQFPLESDDDAFVVGIFGGSVALQFYGHAMRSGTLVEGLTSLPAVSGRDIVVLDFSALAYKQPQQLLVLSYFLAAGQSLDMAIVLDGFNEIALADLNSLKEVNIHLPYYYPNLAMLAARDRSNEELAELLRLKTDSRKAQSLFALARECPLATCHALADQLGRFYERRSRDAAVLFEARKADDGDTLVYVERQKRAPGGDVFEDAADMWARASLMMKQLIESQGGTFVHVLQPNQHHDTGRPFSEQERQVALDVRNPLDQRYRQSVAAGYPVLLSRVPWLRKNGVHLIDAVGVFDDVRGIMYKDTCCHLSREGLEVLTRYVAEEIVRKTGSLPPASPPLSGPPAG